ncbi:MAG TPA: hypothetical protein VFR23_24410 [Jiangellaceae bacterium]|nr:hypothetical protein [Jiangellaceae bacterium]
MNRWEQLDEQPQFGLKTTPIRAIDDGPIATADHLAFPKPAKLPADMCGAELGYLERHGPTRHAETADTIAALMAADSLLPPALCRCDGYRCLAHDTVSGIVQSRFATGRRAVWLIDVQRAIRLMLLWRRELPADFAALVNDAWGDDSFPDSAATRELARRYETERPAYAEHGCSVAYTVASLVEELRAERDESDGIDRGVEAGERRGEL